MRAKEIRELVKIVEESNIGELEITYWWGRKVRISKTATSVTGSKMSGTEIVTTNISTGASLPVTGGETAVTPATALKTDAANNMHEIKSPMVGTFYRAPSPDADPYVREGDNISPGKVLCIIEAMKLMNEIEAEVKGKIVKILAENGRPVEYNQPLFVVELS